MKLRVVGLTLVLMSATSSALAQSGSSAVRIVDLDGISIPYALVSVAKAAPRAADTTGRVWLGDNRTLSLTIGVKRMGYTPYEGTVVRESPSDDFAVVLAPVTREIDAVRTIAPRNTPLSRTGFYDRMERVRKGAILGEFITPEELELRGRGGVTGVFFGKQYARPAGKYGLLGRRDCKVQLLIDGNLVSSNENLEELLNINEVMAIEIYPSTANAPHELIPVTYRGSCGIVAFWTGGRR